MWVLAGSQRRRVPGGAGSRRRARHARPGSGARRSPRRASRTSIAGSARTASASAPSRQVARVDGSDRAPCRRRHGRAGRDVSRPRRRGVEPPGRGRSRARARRLGSASRRDRRLRGASPPQPRRARGQPRAPAFRRRAAGASRSCSSDGRRRSGQGRPEPGGAPPEIGADHLLRRDEPGGGLDPADEPGSSSRLGSSSRSGGSVTAVSVGPAAGGACSGGPSRSAPTRRSRRGRRAPRYRRSRDCACPRSAIRRTSVRSRPRGSGVDRRGHRRGSRRARGAPRPSGRDLRAALEITGGNSSRERQTSAGYDLVACALPALVTLTAAAAEASHPSVRETIAAEEEADRDPRPP